MSKSESNLNTESSDNLNPKKQKDPCEKNANLHDRKIRHKNRQTNRIRNIHQKIPKLAPTKTPNTLQRSKITPNAKPNVRRPLLPTNGNLGIPKFHRPRENLDTPNARPRTKHPSFPRIRKFHSARQPQNRNLGTSHPINYWFLACFGLVFRQ